MVLDECVYINIECNGVNINNVKVFVNHGSCDIRERVSLRRSGISDSESQGVCAIKRKRKGDSS